MTIRTLILAAPLVLAALPAPAQMGQHHHHAMPPSAAEAAPAVPYAGRWDADMARMHADMDIRLSGSPDLDFLLGMMPHHRGAIAMAELALQHARDPQVRALAQNIIWDQQREIQDMEVLVVRRHLGAWPEAVRNAVKPAAGGDMAMMHHDHGAMDHGAMNHDAMDHGAMPGHAGHGAAAAVPYADAWARAMADMHSAMDVDLTGNPDLDFLRGMIPHHAGALAMAKVELAHGRDTIVKDLARDILVAQQLEIAVMQAALARLGG